MHHQKYYRLAKTASVNPFLLNFVNRIGKDFKTNKQNTKKTHKKTPKTKPLADKLSFLPQGNRTKSSCMLCLLNPFHT